MHHLTKEELVQALDMKPHPEGGFYAETYRSDRGESGRRYSTAIYFLLGPNDVSHLHRLKSDEVWHFYLGGPLEVVELERNGEAKITRLGVDFRAKEKPQHVVRAGTWFGSMPVKGHAFSLVGCTVAPGFEFADFEMGERDVLLRAFPKCHDLIRMLT